ncbi:MAG: hypothetical protein LRY76_05585 [Alphaproteobacteria bacterium]|nr:hypothetical protein [Alphaproteobacteria bacterium]MCD8526085.1 hypothetical protein [Alphaproteobacteria bacterium]MCD8570982.1 hypothetical protein [Alphaproteobacteria bacterium]
MKKELEPLTFIFISAKNGQQIKVDMEPAKDSRLHDCYFGMVMRGENEVFQTDSVRPEKDMRKAARRIAIEHFGPIDETAPGNVPA